MNALVVVLSFLFFAFLCALAVVAARVFMARGADGKRSAPGCLGGCAVALALGLIAVIGLVVFVAVLAAGNERGAVRQTLREAREHWRELDEPRPHDPRHDERGHGEATRAADSTAVTDADESVDESRQSVRLVVRWPGHREPWPELLEALREAGLEGDVQVDVDWRTSGGGEQHSVATLVGEVSSARIAGFEARARKALREVQRDAKLKLELLESAVEDLR